MLACHVRQRARNLAQAQASRPPLASTCLLLHSSTRLRPAEDEHDEQTSQSATRRRNRSILLEPDSIILEPRRNALHKRKPTEQDLDDSEQWRANPYRERKGNAILALIQRTHELPFEPIPRKWSAVHMLASPLRKCIWSRRLMPRDFLIPVRVTALPRVENLPTVDGEEDDQEIADSDSTPTAGSRSNASRTVILPRNLLHPAFMSDEQILSETKGRKTARGYIICNRSAVNNAIESRAFQGLSDKADSNEVLGWACESMLRRRVVQELQLLSRLSTRQQVHPSKTGHATASAHRNAFVRALSSAEQSRLLKSSHMDFMSFSNGVSTSTTETAPAALLRISTEPVYSPAVDSPAPFSTLLPVADAVCPPGTIWQTLSAHRVPVYDMDVLFQMPAAPDLSSDVPLPKPNPSRPNPPATLAELHARFPKIYEREQKLATELREQAFDLLGRLSYISGSAANDAAEISAHSSNIQSARLKQRVFAVPGGRVEIVPLLVALWRWRMWTGEGWQATGRELGFGVAAATGRSPPE